MDTLTQMALGAAIGQAIGYKKLGGKAAIYGALGGLIPDLDVFATPYLGDYAEWKYHRHLTHSIFFAPVVAPLLAGITHWIHGRRAGDFRLYYAIWFLALFTHPLLDTLTIYGTMLLAPFSTMRFAIPAVSIIDPVYTIILFTALFLPAHRWFRERANQVAIIGLILSTAFLGYSYWQNVKAADYVRLQLAEQNIFASDVAVYTTIFQPYMRRAVVREGDLMRVGFVSSFAPSEIFWTCQQQDNGYAAKILETDGGRTLTWFSMNQLSIKREGNILTVMDARYGVPGPTVFGFWGLEFALDENGDLVSGEPRHIRVSREGVGNAIINLFRATYGLRNDFLPIEDKNCP